MTQIRIVTDSGSDFDLELAARHNITVVPLKIRFGTEEFIDNIDLTSQDFYDKLGSSDELPATAAPSQGDFETVFRQLREEGATDIFCINLSYQLSATGQSAVAAAEAVQRESGGAGASSDNASGNGGVAIHTFDSTNLSASLSSIAIAAAQAAEQGKSVAEVTDLINSLSQRCRLFGVLGTLEYLQKGGRIGKVQSMLGSALSIKPIVEVRGEVHEAHKARTRRRAFQWMRDHLLAERDQAGGISLLTLAHGFADDFDEFRSLIAQDFDLGDRHVSAVGPTIATHAGPGVVAMSYMLGPDAAGGTGQS